MSKAEFLQELEKRLHVLNEKERQDVLEEYAQHIDLKIANGMSEEEAVKDFGSIEELIAELLDAYSINEAYVSGGSQEQKADGDREKKLYQNVRKAVNETAEKAGQAAQSAGKAAERAGTRLWQLIRHFFLFWWNLACAAWERICRLVRRLTGRPSAEEAQSEQYQQREEEREKMREEKYERREKRREERRRRYEEGLEQRRERQAARMAGTQGRSWLRRFWDGCVRITWLCAVFCIKGALLLCAAPFLVFGLFSLFGTGMVAVLIAQGYPVVGIGVAALGLVLCTLGTVGILLSWVFTGKKKRENKQGYREEETK